MRTITLQVLEGLERGQVYDDLAIPVSIGREEDNTIRLNDERISRFHAKIQEDGGRTILTDLESTNGTRVNGRAVQMRILKPGDQIAIGRCLLLFGSADQIRARIEAGKRRGGESSSIEIAVGCEPVGENGSQRWGKPLPEQTPELPRLLSPGERAQLSDFVGHIHDELHKLATGAEELARNDADLTDMRVPGEIWQRLLQLEMDLAVAIRKMVEPDFVPEDPPADSGKSSHDSGEGSHDSSNS